MNKILFMKKKYSMEEKIRSLKILEMNDFNYNKTAKELKVKRQTLLRWNNELGEKIAKPVRIDNLITGIEKHLEKNREEWSKELWEVKMLAIKRIRELIPHERNLDNVTKLTRLLIEATDGKLSGEEAEEVMGKGTTLFQLVYKQMITNDGIENNSA